MKKLFSLFLVPIFLGLFITTAYPQSFTVFSNAPPNSNGIDTSLAAEIDNASTSVDAALYSLEREVIVDALCNAQSSGVTVRVVTETDSYESDNYGPAYQQLEAAGITVVQDNAGGAGSGLCHDKFFIFDEAKVWTGSYNSTNNGTVANANNAILIDDPTLAGTYTIEFEEMYVSHLFGTKKSDNTTHYFTVDGYPLESYFSPTDGVKFRIQSEIEGAEHSVYFLIFSFTDDDLGDDLVDKYNAGRIVQGAFDAGQRNMTGSEYDKLRDAGIPVKMDDYDAKLHHKVMIIDPGYSDGVVITGASNWSNSAFNRNDEDILIIRHPDVVNEYYGIFRDIYDNHCKDEGGEPVGAIVINEIMSKGVSEDILPEDRANWAESKEEGGSPGEPGEPDTLPPIIIHSPVDRALMNHPISIQCEIYDPNDPEMYSAKEPYLYYRKTGEFNFQSTYMGAFFDEYNGAIPASEVTTDGVEYYITARDWSYNLATSPAFNPQSYPYPIEVVDNPDAVIRFTELMYDPPGELEDESILEWTEIHNVSSTRTVDFTGWEFTDGEGTYAFPSGSSIAPGEYQVLCKTEDGPSGSFTRYIYGPDSVGEITFSNPLGIVTDQLILKDETGLVVEQVDYSANWGASNVRGPNNHTLEKIDPEGPDDGTNWLYSMVEGGTPGAESSPHFIFHKYETQAGWKTRPGIWIEPTLINPGMEECTVYYRLNRDCDVTIKVYNPPQDTPPELCYDEEYFLVTLVDDESKPENMDPVTFAAHTAVWDGTYSGQTAIGNCRIVLWATDTSAAISVCDSNDTMMSTMYHGFDPDKFNIYSHEPTVLLFYQSKPAFIKVIISKKIGTGEYTPIRTLVDNVAFPYPLDGVDNGAIWDGRRDDGSFVEAFRTFKAEIEATDIFGNVVISRPPLIIYGVGPNPRSYFNPDEEDQYINYTISRDAVVTVKIMDKTGTLVATPVNAQSQTAGENLATWDGSGNTGEGIYNFTIEAEGLGQKTSFFGRIALYRFECN